MQYYPYRVLVGLVVFSLDFYATFCVLFLIFNSMTLSICSRFKSLNILLESFDTLWWHCNTYGRHNFVFDTYLVDHGNNLPLIDKIILFSFTKSIKGNCKRVYLFYEIVIDCFNVGIPCTC